MEMNEKQIAADRKDIMVKTDGGMVKPRKSIVKVVNNESKTMIGFKEYKEIYESQEAELDRKIEEAQRHAKETGKKYSDQTGQYKGGKNYDELAAREMAKKLFDKKTVKESEIEEAISNVKKDAKGNVLSFNSTPDKKAASTWSVSYDHGPHMSNTVKVSANSEEEAHAKAEKAAKKLGHNSPMINSAEKHMNESSPFDWKKGKSEIDWKSDDKAPAQSKEGGTVYKAREGSRNAETGGAAPKKSVGRPAGEYGGYKIDKATRDSKEYKDALSAKVRAAKAEGFQVRDEFKKGMTDAIKKRQLEIAGIK